MIKKLTILSISSICILFALNSTAASFDCSKASTYVEKEICRNENISTLDENLNTQYKTLINRSDENANANLKSAQKQWLSTRNKCKSRECIETAYNNRIAQLSELTENNNKISRGTQNAYKETPNPERSCIKELGRIKAKALENWCKDVSPATRPPCNVENSCKMIVEEIDRACKLSPDVFSCQPVGDKWDYSSDSKLAEVCLGEECDGKFSAYCQDYVGVGASRGIVMLENWSTGGSQEPGAPTLKRGTINLKNLPESNMTTLVIVFGDSEPVMESLPTFNLDGEVFALMLPTDSYNLDNPFTASLLQGDRFALIPESISLDYPSSPQVTLKGSSKSLGKIFEQCK